MVDPKPVEDPNPVEDPKPISPSDELTSPAPAPVSEPVAVTEPVATAVPEEPAELAPEWRAGLDQAIEDELGEPKAPPGAPAPAGPKRLELTEDELVERERRAEQRARDRFTEEQQEQAAVENVEFQARQQFLRTLADATTRATERGEEVEPRAIEEQLRIYDQTAMQRASRQVGSYLEQEVGVALAALPGLSEAVQKDATLLAPLQGRIRSPRDFYGARLEIAYNYGVKQGEAKARTNVETEAKKLGRQYGEAIAKRLVQNMASGKGGSVPTPTAPVGIKTEAEIAKMSSEEWEAHREQYYRGVNASRKKS